MIKTKFALKPILSVALLVIAIASTALLMYSLFGSEKTGLEMEQNATVGILPGVDLNARLKELQTQVDESKIAFSVNTHPVFKTGSSAGNLLLENPANNAKLLTAELILDSTGEVIYKSKAIAPGTYLENISLKKKLTKGEYPATVYLKAYTEDTQKFIGQTGAALTISVLA